MEGRKTISALEAEQQASPFLLHAEKCLERSDYGGASEALQKALELVPNDVRLVIALGDIQMRLGDLRGAEREYVKATALAPAALDLRENLANSLATLGTYHQTRGGHEAARLAFERALRVQPDHTGAREGLEALSHKAAHLTISSVVTTHEAEPTLSDAATAIESSDWDRAAELYRHFLQKMPQSEGPHAGLGHALLGQGKYLEAAESLRRAIQLSPNDPKLYNQLGFALAHSGDPLGAEKSFERCLGIAPQNLDALLSLVELYRGQRRFPDALTALERAAEVNPREPDVLMAMGTLAVDLGDRESARTALSTLRRVAPQHEGVQALEVALSVS